MGFEPASRLARCQTAVTPSACEVIGRERSYIPFPGSVDSCHLAPISHLTMDSTLSLERLLEIQSHYLC